MSTARSPDAGPSYPGPTYIDSHYARTRAEPAAHPTMEGTLDCETLVIGGGLAGCATALDLAERGHAA